MMTLQSILACALAVALFQQPARPQTPPRDTPGLPTLRGTSMITGVVVAADGDAKPIRHASVTLVSGNLQFPYVTVTDDDGAFEFANVAAGNYALLGSKPGYVATFFGAKTPGKGQGIPIAVGEGQRVTDVRLALIHGSVITGIVRLQSGVPAVGVSVRVMPVRLESDTRHVSDLPTDPESIEGLTTDDLGRYRAYGLAPGKYVVEVRMEGLNPFGASHLKLTTAEEIQWAKQPATTRPPVTMAPVTYAPVFAPNTPNLADATIITLGANEERTDVDVTTQFVPVATISGRVLYPDGTPVSGAQISMRSGDVRFMDMLMSMFGGSRSRADGTFELRDIRPGAYTLSVRAFTREDKPKDDNSPFAGLSALGSMFGGTGATSPTLWASMDVTVDGHDFDTAVLQLQPGLVVSGKLAFDASSMPAPKDLALYRVMLSPPRQQGSPAEMALAMLGTGVASGAVQADGSFSIPGVTPGRYELKVGGPDLRFNFARHDTGWVLKSAMLRQKDLSDTQLLVSPDQDWTSIAVTMTDRPTELSGAMVDKSGRPAPGFPIVVFPTDAAMWMAGSRRVQQIRPSTDGTFVLAGLPAGRYYLCALTDLDPSDLSSSEFLQSLIPGSIQIALADGQHLVQNVVLQGR